MSTAGLLVPEGKSHYRNARGGGGGGGGGRGVRKNVNELAMFVNKMNMIMIHGLLECI